MVSSALAFYQHLTSHIVPGPQSISYFIAVLLLPTALLIPPSTLSRWQLCSLFLPSIYACLVHSWIRIGGLDVMSVNVALMGLVLLACEDPRRTFRRVHRDRDKLRRRAKPMVDDTETTWEEPYPSKFSQRLSWVFTLMISLRLSNWKIGRESHDKAQPSSLTSRSVFLRNTLADILQCYIILDIASFYAQTDPYFFHSCMSIDTPIPGISSSILEVPELLRMLLSRIIRVSVLGSQLYALLTLMFLIPTLPAIALNATKILPDDWTPHSWPALFGSFSAVMDRGVRGLWGSRWHQMHRYLASTPAYSLTHASGISTSSLLGYALLTTSAFFFSGVMHMGLVPPEPLNTKVSANEMRLRIAGFFWAQIPAIGAEVLVARIFRRIAPSFSKSSVGKALTIFWVATWSATILPILTIPFRELGYWHVYPLPISIMQGIFGTGWYTWSDFSAFAIKEIIR